MQSSVVHGVVSYKKLSQNIGRAVRKGPNISVSGVKMAEHADNTKLHADCAMISLLNSS